MSDYINQFISKVKQDRKYKIYILGFSYGAMIALISATKLKPYKIILCSLSPYFKEDISSLKPDWKKAVGKKRLEDFKNLKFNKLAKNIKSKTIILIGKEESIQCVKRAKDAKRQINKSRLIIIPKVKHDIRQKKYLEEIKRQINKLN